MGLGNLLRVVLSYLLIGEIIGFGYRDGFPMVNALVCITHWIGPTVSHDLRLLKHHDLTKLLHYVISQP